MWIMRSVELFAGGGGLALGTGMAGFRPEAVIEWNRWACDTLRQNIAADHPLARGMRVIEGDVRAVDWSDVESDIDLVSAGPPCQPFSSGGLSRAANDPRDMFPATVDVVRQLKPRAYLVENVKGLTRSAFADYVSYIELQLQHPELVSKPGELWVDHYRRLQGEHTTVTSDLRYNLVRTVVNAADYGAPQQRHRVFFVGFRSDVEAEWHFPRPTHSKAALIHQQATEEYWDRLQVPRRERPTQPNTVPLVEPTGLKPWRTVREAFVGLPEPTPTGSRKYLNHVRQDGARAYPGHTGSAIDWPAKALKAGGHGVPGGENMAVYPDGRLRYFTVREAARLQTFPDRWELHGAWGEAMRQIGNAVPVVLAEAVAKSIHEHLVLAAVRKELASGRHYLGVVSA